MNSKQRGSTVLWALLGLLAFAALAWFCVARHVPVLEQRLQTSVLGAIKPLNPGPINVEMNGYTANLSGAVQNSSIRDNLIATASAVAGVSSVNDNLQIIAAPITASVDSTDGAEALIVAPASDPTPVETAEPTDTPASTPSDTPSNTSEGTTPIPETESLENSDKPATPAVTQTTNTGTPTAAVEEPAELNIAVNDRTLTLTGRVQDQRELRPIVESVMTTFDLNYVSNKTTAAQSIGPMSWMDGLLTALPDMSGIQNPSVDVFDKQINVSGTVNSQADQNAIVELLQKNLPNLSVVSRLRVDESAATATAEATVEPIPETDATAESEIDATAEASENTDAVTADENVALQAQKQAAIEEQFRIEAQKLAEAAAIEDAEQQRIEAEAAEAAANEAERAKEKAVEAARVAAKKEAEDATAAAKRIAEEEAQTAAEDPVTTASNKLSEAFAALPDTRVLFRIGSNELTPDSEDRLDQIATLLLEYPVVPVGIKGHTDNQGDDALNLALSQQRANAVREYLVTQGISIFRLSSFGYGESLPIDTNDTPEGRAANRRIEFSF